MSLDEPELPDDYPIYPGYLYVADGKVVSADYPATAAQYKAREKVSKLCRCDIVGRKMETTL